MGFNSFTELLFLCGKCRYCRKPISFQYPLVEFITGALFAAMFWRVGELNLELFVNLILICFFLVIAVYDFKHYLILDKVVFPGLVFATIYMIYIGEIYSGLIGAAAISVFFYLQYLLSKGRWIGLGDVKFGLLLGMVAGFPGSVLLLFIAYMLGAVTGIFLITIGKKQIGSVLPFGTFLALSAVLTMVYGQPLLNWYLDLIGIR